MRRDLPRPLHCLVRRREAVAAARTAATRHSAPVGEALQGFARRSEQGEAMTIAAHFFDGRIPDRRWRKVIPCPATGCWLWVGKTARNGYGVLSAYPGRGVAHRYFYSTLIAPPPRGLDLDHLCRVRCCVNPLHLEPVTRSVNLRRGIGASVTRARTALITHCPSGHPYDENNTYFRPGTRQRDCLTCRRQRSDAYNKAISASLRGAA